MASPGESINFPLEILEQIVDKDVASPRLLSVSRELRHCALRHLFKTVEISNTKNRIGQLRDLIVAADGSVLSNFSGIACYAKDLVIQFSFRQGDFTLHDFFNQPAVLDILEAIQRAGCLASLTFCLLINPRKEYVKPHAWSDLPNSFRDLFASLIRLPSVTSLTIDWLDDLPRELVASANLESCALTRSRNPPSAPSVASMRSLKTDHMYAYDDADGHFRNLRKAEVINMSPEGFIQSWKLIRAAGDNLHSLIIVDAFREKTVDFMRPISVMHRNSVAVKDTPSLAVVPNLRELKYSAYYVSHTAPSGSILRELFAVPTAHKQLLSLILELEYHTLVRSVQDSLYTVVSSLPWARLDELWTGGRFPALKTIEVRVKMPHLIPGLVNAPGIKGNIAEFLAGALIRTSLHKTLFVPIELSNFE